MGRVDVAEDVSFKGGVHGDYTKSTDDLGVVGDFRRTENNMLLEEFDVADDFILNLVGNGERTGGTEFATALLHEVDNSVLNYLGIHFEGRNLLGIGKAVEDGVCHVAHT